MWYENTAQLDSHRLVKLYISKSTLWKKSWLGMIAKCTAETDIISYK